MGGKNKGNQPGKTVEDAEKSLKDELDKHSPEPQPEDGTQPEPIPDPQPEPEANPEPTPDPVPEVQPEPVVEPQPEDGIKLPSDDEIEKTAEMLAKNPAALEAWRKTYERALNIHKEINKPAPLSDDEVKAAAHERLVKKYGKDYVTAKRGKETMIFSRQTWNMMGKGRQGWVEETKQVPEAQA